MNENGFDEAFRILKSWSFLGAGDVSAWLGIPRRKVLLFVEQGIIRNSETSPGSGKSRKFSLVDLTLFSIVARLDAMGIAPRYLQSIAGDLNRIVKLRLDPDGKLPDILFIFQDTDNALSVRFREDLSELGSVVILVDLAKIEFEVLKLFEQKAPFIEEGRTALEILSQTNQPDSLLSRLGRAAIRKNRD